MSKLSFEIFNTEYELVGITSDGENRLVFEFSEEYEGFVRIGDLTSRLEGGRCEFDLRQIENGEFSPSLVIPNRIINLPQIKKLGRALEILDCTDGYIRSASQRERALEAKVSCLERQLEEISSKVYGETIL